MCCTQLTENAGCKNYAKKLPAKAHIDNWTKNLLNSNISSACPHNMVNVGPLMAEMGSGVWGTPANFNGFHILASLLHQRHSKEINQTLHDV